MHDALTRPAGHVDDQWRQARACPGACAERAQATNNICRSGEQLSVDSAHWQAPVVTVPAATTTLLRACSRAYGSARGSACSSKRKPEVMGEVKGEQGGMGQRSPAGPPG